MGNSDQLALMVSPRTYVNMVTWGCVSGDGRRTPEEKKGDTEYKNVATTENHEGEEVEKGMQREKATWTSHLPSRGRDRITTAATSAATCLRMNLPNTGHTTAEHAWPDGLRLPLTRRR